ncbi:MAG: hypothetical protein HLUCCA24_00760 [Rhodobacteraceae bacterium HLUCCA24]|nr:MAG: hypothetical protein HLUCCA24_00760 [Rhodobacteraceae bacterium HLUCCA24]
MVTRSQDTAAALARLEAALSAPDIPDRAAQDCARLLDKLRRPARIGIFGTDGEDVRWMLCGMLGADPLAGARVWPALQLVHGDKARTTATLADGSTLSRDGAPAADLMTCEVVFLSITAPWPVLQRMSFLALPAGTATAEQSAALSWAARRTDIAIWCTRAFDAAEAAIWAEAPARLKDHALMVRIAADGSAPRTAGDTEDFVGVFDVSRSPGKPADRAGAPGLARLQARIEADIDDALRADVDAARLFLHRFGHLAEAGDAHRAAGAAPAPCARGASQAGVHGTADPERLVLLSEPMLYLRRRARLLFETLELARPDSCAWGAQILAGCTETLEGLRERAARWPEDDFGARQLREAIEEACDVSVLLQAEGEDEQVEDAAVLLLQLREEFERELAA